MAWLKPSSVGMVLRRRDYKTMRRHVAAAFPREACGLVAGQGGWSAGVYPVENVHPHPWHRFRMDPQEQWRAMHHMLQRGVDLLAIYHSHPLGQPLPSAIDRREMAYPEALYLLWAPLGPAHKTWVCRAFQWQGDGFREVPLRLE